MKIFTPASGVYNFVDLKDFVGLQIHPHDDNKLWKLVAVYDDPHETFVIIKISTKEDLDSLVLALSTNWVHKDLFPTTPTLH